MLSARRVGGTSVPTLLLATLLLFLTTSALACNPVPDRAASARAEAHAADIATVTALNLGWNEADLAADRDWFEHNLAEDFIAVTSRRGAMEDKASTLAGVGQYKLEDANSTDLVATVHGDSARVTGIFHTRGTDADGKPFVRSVRYIDTYIRRDGRWQVWSSQGTQVLD